MQSVVTNAADWFVFPIRAGEKMPPLISDNLNAASNDPRQLTAWGKRFPGCNWGLSLAKSAMIVVDVDRKEGKRGQETFDDLDLFYGWPPTFTVATPSDGWHLYYRATPTVQHVYAQGKHGFGPDIDSTNYVLLAGSTLKDGRSYRAINNLPIAPAPDWFARYLKPHQHVASDQVPVVELDQAGNIAWAVDYLVRRAPPSVQGCNGEKTLLDVAAVLKDHGISEYMAVNLLAEHYNTFGRCDPLWDVGKGPPQDRLDVKVHNAWLYLNQNAPGSDTPQAEFGDDVFDDATIDRIVAAFERREHDPVTRLARKQARKAKLRERKWR